MTEQEFVVYQSTMIDYVDSVTIDEARECLGEDYMQSTNSSRRSTRSRKRNHLSELCTTMTENYNESPAICEYNQWAGHYRPLP